MSKVELAAVEAVFHRQLNSAKALSHVVEVTACKPADAKAALKQVMTGYQNRK